MLDLKPDECGMFTRDYRPMLQHLKCERELRHTVEAFCRNLDRVAALVEFTPYLVEQAMRDQYLWCLACFQIVGRPDLPKELLAKRDLVLAKFEELDASQPKGRQDFPSLFLGHKRILKFVYNAEGSTRTGMKSILAAQVIAAWTAFETLAEDLWIASVNARPIKLVDRIMKTRGSGDEGKTVPIWQLQRRGYNIAGSMGEILCGGFNFNRLDGILKAYDAAFGPEMKSREIREEGYRQVSETNLRALDALEALRNVLVHSGGVVDEQFAKRWKRTGSNLPGEIAVGHEVPLDGAHAAGLTNVAINKGLEFVSLADYVLSLD